MRSAWDDELAVLSSENVNFALETAGLGSRFGAAAIDIGLQLLVGSLFGWLFVWMLSFLPANFVLSSWASNVAQAVLGLLIFALAYGYYFCFEWLWDGQTPGKRWLGLRVRQSNGLPLSMWAALSRNLLRTIDFLPVLYGLGAIVALWNGYNRRIGDLVADTVVVRERMDATKAILDIDAAADAFLTLLNAAPQSSSQIEEKAFSPVASANTPLLSVNEREMLHDFLARRAKMKPIARARLATQLATLLASKNDATLPNFQPSQNWPSPLPFNASEPQREAWLEAVARADRE